MPEVAFDCRSVGFSCEWALRAPSPAEVLRRMSEHVRCAHAMPELSADLRVRVEAAVRLA